MVSPFSTRFGTKRQRSKATMWHALRSSASSTAPHHAHCPFHHAMRGHLTIAVMTVTRTSHISANTVPARPRSASPPLPSCPWTPRTTTDTAQQHPFPPPCVQNSSTGRSAESREPLNLRRVAFVRPAVGCVGAWVHATSTTTTAGTKNNGLFTKPGDCFRRGGLCRTNDGGGHDDGDEDAVAADDGTVGGDGESARTRAHTRRHGHVRVADRRVQGGGR